MSRKNNYPKTRKPASLVKCPVCGQTYKARGIKIHVRMVHGVEYMETIQTIEKEPANPVQPVRPENATSPEDTIVELMVQLETAYKNRRTDEYSTIVHKIAKVRATMGWSAEDIVEESDQFLSGSFWHKANPKSTPKQKRLVVMFEDNSYRPIDITDFEEVSNWIYELQDIKADLKEKIQRYKDIPALLKIERELMGI